MERLKIGKSKKKKFKTKRQIFIVRIQAMDPRAFLRCVEKNTGVIADMVRNIR